MKSTVAGIDIDAANYTSGEARAVAGNIPDKLFSVWLARGIIRAARRGRTTVGGKQRPGQRLHSIRTITEAKFTFRFVDGLAMSASEASKVAQQVAADITKWPMVSSVKDTKTIPVFLFVSRLEGDWKTEIFSAMVRKFKAPMFDPRMERPFAVFPGGSDFASVWWQCAEISGGV